MATAIVTMAIVAAVVGRSGLRRCRRNRRNCQAATVVDVAVDVVDVGVNVDVDDVVDVDVEALTPLKDRLQAQASSLELISWSSSQWIKTQRFNGASQWAF